MTKFLELDPVLMTPDALGEALREQFWDPEKGFGCYANFDYRPEVKELARPFKLKERIECWAFDDGVWCYDSVQGARRRVGDYDVFCIWAWDGDGCLVFQLNENGETRRTIVNTDCKKDHGWHDYQRATIWVYDGD